MGENEDMGGALLVEENVRPTGKHSALTREDRVSCRKRRFEASRARCKRRWRHLLENAWRRTKHQAVQFSR